MYYIFIYFIISNLCIKALLFIFSFFSYFIKMSFGEEKKLLSWNIYFILFCTDIRNKDNEIFVISFKDDE